MNRVTEGWLRRFIHAYKNASFMDKMSAVHREPNPYYLLEWLIVSDEESEFWLSWEGERTPGVEKGGSANVESFFRYELPFELCFGSSLDEWRSSLLHTAFHDLAGFYGPARWNEGVSRFRSEIMKALEQLADYENDIKKELAKLEHERKEEKRRLEQEREAEEWASEEELEAELKALELRYNRRKKEVPAKLLRKSYENERLLPFIVHRGIPHPQKRLKAFVQTVDDKKSATNDWIGSADNGDVDGMTEWIQANHNNGKMTLFSKWLSSFIGKSDMTRRTFDVANRQRFALHLAEHSNRLHPGLASPVINAVYEASGIEEALSEQADNVNLFHLFVWSALPIPERRKLLREGVLLTNWATFASAFAEASPETGFERLSWVFCLDPESLQHRLLRSTGESPKENRLAPEDIIRKCCLLFTEGIRRGVDPKLIVSLYGYLAKHDREAFYSFVHGTKSLPEALPMFEIPQQSLSPLFRGEGVRQTSARKHLQQLLYEWLEQGDYKLAEQSEKQLAKLAGAISCDKRAAVSGWLQRHERDWREYQGGDCEFPLTRLLKFRWLGTKEDAKEQHAAVEEWLRRHSDWVQFETDTPLTETGMRFRIVRPGALDAETGELLARVLVRAEWADKKQVLSLLDDLKNL